MKLAHKKIIEAKIILFVLEAANCGLDRIVHLKFIISLPFKFYAYKA
jgi:hypothetical protein